MNKISKKIVAGIFFASLFFAVGIFFGGTVVLASNSSGSMMDCENELPSMRLGDCAAQKNLETKKTGPINNSLMPCCLERHDNSETALPSVLQDRIRFSEQALIGEVDTASIAAVQKTYLSSKSPPEKADILSSVVKKE